MKKITVIILLLYIMLSCNRKVNITQGIDNETIIENIEIKDTVEFFVDSINFGNKLKNKIEVYKVDENLMTYAKIYLSEKINGKWIFKDSLSIECDRINKLDVSISDFNNDNYNDLLFTSGTAARGANIVQTLVLFTEKNNLKWIKNSDNYPNLMYNEKLNCIDALIFTGGLTTKFLNLKNDSLVDFASVDQRDGRITIEIKDEKGKWKEIESFKDNSEDMKRFINFNPLEVRQ